MGFYGRNGIAHLSPGTDNSIHAYLAVFGEITFWHLDLVLLLGTVPELCVGATEALPLLPEVPIKFRLDLLDAALQQTKQNQHQKTAIRTSFKLDAYLARHPTWDCYPKREVNPCQTISTACILHNKKPPLSHLYPVEDCVHPRLELNDALLLRRAGVKGVSEVRDGR